MRFASQKLRAVHSAKAMPYFLWLSASLCQIGKLILKSMVSGFETSCKMPRLLLPDSASLRYLSKTYCGLISFFPYCRISKLVEEGHKLSITLTFFPQQVVSVHKSPIIGSLPSCFTTSGAKKNVFMSPSDCPATQNKLLKRLMRSQTFILHVLVFFIAELHWLWRRTFATRSAPPVPGLID